MEDKSKNEFFTRPPIPTPNDIISDLSRASADDVVFKIFSGNLRDFTVNHINLCFQFLFIFSFKL